MTRFGRSTYVAAALAATIATVVAPHARAADVRVDGPYGVLCGLDAVADPTAEAGTRSGDLSGGPLMVPGPWGDATSVGSGTLECRVQVGVGDHSGTGPAVSGHGTGVAAIAPSAVNFVAYDTDPVYVCTEFTFDESGQTWYFDAVNDTWSEWSSVSCDLAIAAGGDGADGPVWETVDSIVCPMLAIVFPPEGDVVLPVIGALWDCPPYGNVFRGSESGGGGGGGTTDHGSHAPKPPTTPYYPSGIIQISSTVPGQPTITYSSFTPAKASWSCTEAADKLSVSCTPPAAPIGQSNVCGTVGVAATNNAGGSVAGSSHCASTSGAYAVSFGPSATPATNSASSNGTFPWSCAAAPAQTIPGPWDVKCTIGN